MTNFFFPDNTALINFHIIGRWDLLEAAVKGRARWSASVSSECSYRTKIDYPGMYAEAYTIFGAVVEPDLVERINAGVLRTAMADPTNDSPKKHLGEAETITIIESRFQGSRFITDDWGASQFAQQRGIECFGTGDLLVAAERSFKLISTADRNALEVQLAAAKRKIRYFKTKR